MMQPPDFFEIRDLHVASRLLDQTLCVLSKSDLRASAASIARDVGLLPCHISRMRSVWKKPVLRTMVPLHRIQAVLHYLCQRYPTLVIRPNEDGAYTIRLYKRYEGLKANQLREPGVHIKKRPPRPGTTRWYMSQENPSE
jgi:hypothetical protein